MSLRAFINGRIVPLEEAAVGILDLGLLRGFGVYEGIAAFEGEPFHFEDHYARLARSAKALELAIPYSKEEILKAMRELLASNAPLGRAIIRLVLTGGRAEGGIEYAPGHETFYFTAEPAVALAPELYEKGASLITHEHERFMPEHKTIHYITAVNLQKDRKAAGAIEILYVNKGTVLECATSNIFIVKEGKVLTPTAGVLPGITRKIVLELARAAGYPVEEREISIEELAAADEVFITSSFKDIVPVVKIDGALAGGGIPGATTKDLMARFSAYAIKGKRARN